VGGIGSEPDAWTQLVEEEDRKRQRLSYTLSVYRGFGSGANKLLVLSFLTAIGGGMAWFVLILYIYELFPELTNVAIIFSIASWTSVVLFLPGGALVDRYDHSTYG
jgi:MFS family permease